LRILMPDVNKYFKGGGHIMGRSKMEVERPDIVDT
jgi:hypothetical protein